MPLNKETKPNQSISEFYVHHFLEQILVVAHTICQHSQILTSCAIPNGSTFPTSHAYA